MRKALKVTAYTFAALFTILVVLIAIISNTEKECTCEYCDYL